MRWFVAALVLLLVPVPAAAADLSGALERGMGKAAPGATVLVIQGFKPGTEAVRGFQRKGRPEPVRPGARWHLGSDTKAMTATLVGRLVDKGMLSWDTPLERMLPDLAAVMRSEYRDVTLVDLMSHRAGLPENPAGEGMGGDKVTVAAAREAAADLGEPAPPS